MKQYVEIKKIAWQNLIYSFLKPLTLGAVGFLFLSPLKTDNVVLNTFPTNIGLILVISIVEGLILVMWSLALLTQLDLTDYTITEKLEVKKDG